MDIPFLLSEPAQKYMREHAEKEAAELLLGASRFPQLDVPALVLQMEARKKAQYKLPGWYGRTDLLFPPKLSMEQCSSELTAGFKATLMQGEHLVDLTGGMGIDTVAWAQVFKRVTYVENSELLCDLARHNFPRMGRQGVEIRQEEAESFVNGLSASVDAFYVDPARRKEGAKVFHWEDCSPDMTKLLPHLLTKAPKVLIKASPMLDLQLGIESLKKVTEVHVLAVDNDCKEVLFLCSPVTPLEPRIYCHRAEKNVWQKPFDFTFSEEVKAEINYSAPQKYLYEPFVDILKAGAFRAVGHYFGVHKLHPHSHLYTSEHLVSDFPGRRFKIIEVLSYDRKALSMALKDGKANITVRNFPEGVDQIRKKTGLKDGGSAYLFATTLQDGKYRMLLTEKV